MKNIMSKQKLKNAGFTALAFIVIFIGPVIAGLIEKIFL